ncbi:hypothetical protein IJG92_02445 [Candidatus Saccharibacteria bacterium]|nr:hypothetical protein [Candidatus Saccharibacteria bacterium]MBQ6149893.1 hypothetical protein [Candidatus Saccharibacteria bacterium]
MDSQDYLDQISRTARPPKQNKGGIAGILSSKWFKWGLGALVALIVIIIFGSMLGGKETLEEKGINLKLRLDGTSEAITEYQGNIKSSLLRSLSSSLKGVFTNTSSQLSNYLTTTYGYEAGREKDAVKETAEMARDELMNELFEAKINGLLDRVFAHKMALEIYSVMSDEAGIANSSSDEALKSLLSTSYDSLNNLYTQFNDFSETNNK